MVLAGTFKRRTVPKSLILLIYFGFHRFASEADAADSGSAILSQIRYDLQGSNFLGEFVPMSVPMVGLKSGMLALLPQT